MQYSERDEKGYSWFFFHPNNQWMLSSLVSLAILAASIVFFVWCTRVSDDMGGDSFAGLVFAIASTTFMFLAAVSFSLRRRARKRAVGELNAVLNWHVWFGIIALVMVFLHAFGNYNPRTGTYALYAMIAMVISGFIGRILDRMMPHLIAQRVRKALTPQGEDRIEAVTQRLQAVQQGKVSLAGLWGKSETSRWQSILQSGGDMAYGSLEDALLTTNRSSGQRSGSARRTPYPGSQEYIRATQEVEQAFTQEMLLRYVIRYWRIFHIILAIVTVGLTLWHIEYAFALIIPALQKFGFGYLLPWP